jgi:cytochrome c peroxidase
MRTLAIALLVLCAPAVLWADGFASLKTASVPQVPDLDRYVRDRDALLVLGKALFWDVQVGSDGHTACATCHFHAGADHRSRNQLSNPQGAFEPNHQQTWSDFPFRVFADPNDNRSTIVHDSSERAGSAGMFARTFSGLMGAAAEQGADTPGAPAFRIGNLNIRQVTTRNAPSVINAAFHVRAFRDGRASDVFTGRTAFGDSDPRANAVAVSNGQLVPEKVRLINSALASQAVAPPVNSVEMSYEGRTWPVIGRKLLALRPLALQRVAPDDSVLGPYVHSCCGGLDPSVTYRSLVEAAFQPAYWDSVQLVDETGHVPGEFTAAELNFPIFFGLAIQTYESMLIADDTRFDRFLTGESGALTLQEISGFLAFQTRGFCQFCHSGPELTVSTYSFTALHGSINPVLTGVPGSLQYVFSDTGFFHTGVRAPSDDPGLDNTDDFGVPISLAARAAEAPLGIAGAFKVPGLRNVEFTGPYFHNGGQASLEQVVDFYARGGDFPNSIDLPVEVIPDPLTPTDRASIVAFLKALSDDRVRFERAPFDHPEICVPAGYADAPPADPLFPLSAVDTWVGIPAVGRNGNAVPLQTFEELLKGIGTDGSRAHTLTDACTIL